MGLLTVNAFHFGTLVLPNHCIPEMVASRLLLVTLRIIREHTRVTTRIRCLSSSFLWLVTWLLLVDHQHCMDVLHHNFDILYWCIVIVTLIINGALIYMRIHWVFLLFQSRSRTGFARRWMWTVLCGRRMWACWRRTWRRRSRLTCRYDTVQSSICSKDYVF